MAPGGSLFETYENDYCNKATDVSRKIQTLAGLSGEQKRARLREVESDIKDAERVIQRMDMEARSFSQDKGRELLQKLKEYKADIAKLKDEAKSFTVQAANELDRAELGLGDDYGVTSAGQRERLLKTTERLNKTSDRIAQGRQTLLETEELGVNILQDLHSQRQTILRARDTLHEADDNISRARRVLATMSRRLMTNKLLMFGIAALLLGSIILVLYYKIMR